MSTGVPSGSEPPGPLATVIVPSYQGFRRLGPLLESLQSQDFTGSWECLLVLDGPSPETESLLHTWADRLPLRWLVQDRAGVATALNRGYAEARGRILLRCDDDLTLPDHWLSGHLRWHDAASPGGYGVISLTRDVFPDSAYARAYGRPANQRGLAASYQRPKDQLWIHWAACNSVSREAWAHGGGFDVDFGYGEDSELGWRLQQAGVTLVVDKELEVLHRGPAMQARDRVPRAFLAGASRQAFRTAHPEAAWGDAAPETSGLRARDLWTVAVRSLARLLGSQSRCRRLGGWLDRIAPLTPTPILRRLIALGVEAAGVAGQRRGRVSRATAFDWAAADRKP